MWVQSLRLFYSASFVMGSTLDQSTMNPIAGTVYAKWVDRGRVINLSIVFLCWTNGMSELLFSHHHK